MALMGAQQPSMSACRDADRLTRMADFRAVHVKCADSMSVHVDPCGFLHNKT
jgi:hypothetical protein